MRPSSPHFNRLLIFDDRLPHAVERIEGAMDPGEGRFVLHGHISEGGPIVEGALPAAAIAGPIGDVLGGFRGEAAAAAGLYHGPLVVAIWVGQTGSVTDCRVLLDRVIHPDPGHADWEGMCEAASRAVSCREVSASGGRDDDHPAGCLWPPAGRGGLIARGGTSALA